MHELSIALSMIEQVEQQAAAQGGGVRSIQVKIGELSGVDVEALRFAWEIARAGTALAASELVIERVPLRVRCPQCGRTRTPEMQTLPLGLARFLSYQEDSTGALYAFCIMVLAPGLLLFLMAQREFVQGLSAGATKG